MALTDKNIVITPNTGQSSDPQIVFSGADASTGPQNITVKVYPNNGGALSFEGSVGQLFSIINSMSGTIYSVNDISGIPSIEVLDTGTIKLAQYSGDVVIGNASSDSNYKVHVNGNVSFNGPNSFIIEDTANRSTYNTNWWEDPGWTVDSPYLTMDKFEIKIGSNLINYPELQITQSDGPNSTTWAEGEGIFIGGYEGVASHADPNKSGRTGVNLRPDGSVVCEANGSKTTVTYASISTYSGQFSSIQVSNPTEAGGAPVGIGYGSIGVGVNAPNVAGTANINNSLGVGTAPSGVAGEIRATNNITAYYSSDRTQKENIRDIDSALAKTLFIGGKYFDWTDEYIQEHGGPDEYFMRKHDFGVIAQDVEQVFPVAVRKKQDGKLAVDYEKLCALAFAAIKELNEKIDKLNGAK